MVHQQILCRDTIITEHMLYSLDLKKSEKKVLYVFCLVSIKFNKRAILVSP